MILSGVATFFFGFAYTAGIHSYGYLIGMQVGVFKEIYQISDFRWISVPQKALFISHSRCSMGCSSQQDGLG